MPNSRIEINPSTLLPSIHTFGELSQFLRAAVADEDSTQFGEGMGHLASHIEAIVARLKLGREREVVAPMLMDLMMVLRGHHAFVVALNTSWRGMYEYAAYLAALNNFRVLIGQWLLEGDRHGSLLAITAEDFEMVAWRALGEGILLIDMYEQWHRDETKAAGDGDEPPETRPMDKHPLDTQPAGQEPSPANDPRIQRAMNWWAKLRL